MAEIFRRRHAAEVEQLDRAGLEEAVRAARLQATALGIKDPQLRARFMFLGTVRFPRFWENPAIAKLLSARTGTPEARFNDACAFIRIMAIRAGMGDRIWW
ncbi:hypothetical protein [Sorangium cellulosum]|uniref:hypothetical protein n=1 Tax=Sorangium cellulosum TaxID=56 RepID=UPI0013316FC1|nr:hypothetical protein [Sorangium cellulosum]